LALSTACPIWRGYLSDVDSRWNILRETTDDRTKEEIENKIHCSSRYSCAPLYLSETSIKYNDIQLNIDDQVYQTLIKHG
jgi:glutamate--cysteine ligase catalytic subunit